MLDKKALTWYLAIAFGFSWILFTLPLAFSALGEQTVSMIRLLCWMIAMWGPGIAAIVTTLFVLKEPFGTLGLKRFGKFRYYLAAWF
ncbi:MAG TPA: hypothetical protein DCG54_13955, partial [Anaerolineae bacterium]|nr:hypothetical protein [Anaerolineae bacterium]